MFSIQNNASLRCTIMIKYGVDHHIIITMAIRLINLLKFDLMISNCTIMMIQLSMGNKCPCEEALARHLRVGVVAVTVNNSATFVGVAL